MSGGRATVFAKKGGKMLARQAGDITATSPEGHALTDNFYIECKAYRNLGIDRFIYLDQGTLAKFWKETKKQAKRHGRRPMMIVKQNGFPSLVLVDRVQPGAGLEPLQARDAHLILLDDLLGTPFKDGVASISPKPYRVRLD